MKVLKEHSIFVVIIVVCAVLRFLPLFDYQFTLDEMSALIRTNFHGFGDLIEKGVKIDAHPALLQVFIFYLVKLFGYAAWVVKLPFLLMSLGAVVYAYFFSLRNFSKQAGVFSALIFSFSLVFVFYAPIARMYIAGVFFSTALLFYFFEIFFLRQAKSSNYFLLGLFALLSALNQHLNALFALTVCASGCLFLSRSTVKGYLLTCGWVVVLYLPHLPVTLYQLGIGGIGLGQDGWLPVPEKTALLSFLQVLLGTGKTWLVVSCLVAVALILKRNARLNNKQGLLVVLFLVNFAVIYFYSVFRAPVFQNSALLFSSVGFVLAVSSLLEFKNKYVFYTAALVLGGSLLYKTYLSKDYLHQAVQTVFDYQFQRTVHYKRLFGDKAVYPVFLDADEFMKELYFKKYETRFDCKIVSDTAPLSNRAFNSLIAGLSSDYLVLASSMPSHQALALDYFPYLIENTQTQGINYKVYSRRQEDKDKVVRNDSVLKFSDVAAHGNFNYTKINNSNISPASFFFPFDRSNEFPFDAQAKYTDFVSAEGQVVLLKVRFKPLADRPSGQLVACISITGASAQNNYGYVSNEMGDFIPAADSSIAVYVNDFIGTNHKPAAANQSKLNVYIWNKGKDRLALTAFEIRLIDFWHQKWHFWD